MKLLAVHNAYQQRGGEDAVMDAEVALLRGHGHEVIEYRRHNDELVAQGALRSASDTLWSRRTTAEIGALIEQHRPALIHAHNTFPLISPSLYWAAAKAGVPVVQTLHNFRLLCPQAMLLRESQVCEDCIGTLPWPAVVHRCYRDSRTQSAAIVAMLGMHRAAGTWSRKVARYIALNEFCRAKFIEGGLPADRIAVKPNFVVDPGPSRYERFGLLFVGRLAPEKGIGVLADAARQLPRETLRVAGSGPESARLASVPSIVPLGSLPPTDVAAEMARAVALVMPSIWYETFGLVVIEAFAAATPVITSRLGAMAELVEDGVTGILVQPGNAVDLAAKMNWALRHPERMLAMGQAARRVYEQRYTPQVNHAQLMSIYEGVIRRYEAT